MTYDEDPGPGRNPFDENQFDDEPDEWFAMRKELLKALEAWETNGDDANQANMLWRIAELTTEITRLRSEMAAAGKLIACALEE